MQADLHLCCLHAAKSGLLVNYPFNKIIEPLPVISNNVVF